MKETAHEKWRREEAIKIAFTLNELKLSRRIYRAIMNLFVK